MTITELENQVNLLSLIGSNYKVKKISENQYRVNPCPICNHKDHFTIYTDTNSYSSFSECCKGGKAYKYLMEVEGMNESQAYEKLLNLTGNEKSPIVSNSTKNETTEPLRNYANPVIKLYNNQAEKDKQYFINRGLTPETIERFKLFVGDLKGDGEKRAYIPSWKNGEVLAYTSRATTPEQEEQKKYDNSPGKSILFNIDKLRTLDQGERVIVTEGQLDTLVLEQLGFNSVSLGGSNKTNLLMETIEDIPGAENLIYYTMFDNDEAGDRAREKLDLKHLKVKSEYNDITEWHEVEGVKVREGIENQLEGLTRPHSLYNYIQDKLAKDIEGYKQYKDRKTGFENLDKITSIYPGLYVIGGLSTLGKTTFMHQLADQMAEKGEHVLFYSLEMATLELITKSIARKTVQGYEESNFNRGVTSLQIRVDDIPGSKRPIVEKAIQDYEPIAKRFNIVEGNFKTNIDNIRCYVKDYIQENKVKPIVIIDYLQIIPGSENSFNSKEKIDQIVTGLKQLSRDYNITVFVVSSLNRSNYLTPIDFESFKESGGIEYTADVVWGLQLQIINNELFNKDKNIKEKRDSINQAKESSPRKIELVCLKNRNGISNYSCNFDYYPMYDYFVNDEKKDYSNIANYKRL